MLRRRSAILAEPAGREYFALCGTRRFVITSACETHLSGLLMTLSRRLLLVLLLVILAGPNDASAANPGAAPPVVLIERFYAELLAVMKEAKRLSFDQRYARLAPAVARTLDLPLMTRIAIGPGWARLAPDQQQRLTEAFSRYTISNYANRFGDYGGERFEVDPNPTANPNGMLVKSGLVKSNGEKVVLNYLVHQVAAGSWQVIDVYLSGTVSELAARRSEFVAVLQRDGADGLLSLIERRTAALRAG
jgi:phospholipid transport system substrate-binding protein